jgi:hypothetical protein
MIILEAFGKMSLYLIQNAFRILEHCGQFLPAKSDTMEFLTNGHIAFLKQSMAGLEIDIDESVKAIDMQSIVDKFSRDLPTVVPVTQSRAYVRMMGDGVEMTAPCRQIDLAYTLFPDAVFYQWGTPESSEKPPMLCVVSDGEPVGFIAGMKLPENFWNIRTGLMPLAAPEQEAEATQEMPA